MPTAVLEQVSVPDTLDEAGVAGRVDGRVVGKAFVGACDRIGAGDRASVVLGRASFGDQDVVEAGGGVVIDMGAFWSAYSCTVVPVY